MYRLSNGSFKNKMFCVWIIFLFAWSLILLGFEKNGFASPVVVESPVLKLFGLRETSPEIVALSSRDGANLFGNINKLFEEGQYPEIKAYAEKQIALHPKNGLAHEILGTALFMMGANENAEDVLKKAVVLEPEESGIYAKLGIIQMNAGQIDKAQKNLEKAIQLNPENRVAHQYAGLLFEYKKEYSQAIFHFRKGIEGSGPLYLGVSVNLGRLLNENKRYEETIDLLSPRLSISSKIFEAHMILAYAYLKTSRFREAKSRFERASELTPSSLEARLGTIMCMRSSGEADAALNLIETLVQENSEWVPALMEYGEILLMLEHPNAAKEAFEKTISLGSSSVTIEKRMALYHIEHKDFEAAQNIYQTLIRTDKADTDVYAKMSELFQARENYGDGISILQKGLQKYPGNDYLTFRLGASFAAVQEYDKAVQEFKRVLVKSPNDPIVLNYLSIAQAKAGDATGSLQSAEKLYSLQPKNINAGILYASRLNANGKFNESEHIYRRVLVINPKNVLILNNLADLLAKKGDLQEAEKLARQLNEISGKKNGLFLDTLGWILYRQDQFSDAKKILSQAKEKQPNTPIILFHLGMTLAAAGEYETARQALEYAIKAKPNAEWAPEAKKKIQEIL